MPLLQDQLDEITQRTRTLVQPERLQTGDKAIAELFSSGIEQRIFPTGETAPQFALKDNNGRLVHSADLLALGPLILNFFRGRWCPYCMAELNAWRDLYPQVRERGALLVAISPQTVHQNDLLVHQHNLPFPVLSDAGCTVAEQFRLVYTVPDYHQRQLRGILVNLPFIDGDPSWKLPVPATYAIRRDGAIAFARGHADHRVRPEPQEVLATL